MTAERTPAVVVIGDALIDEIRDAGGARELIGGAALNVAVGLKRLGAQTTLIAMVGDDEPGANIRSYLVDYGVRLVSSPAPHGSSRAIVTRDDAGEPQYFFNQAAQERSIRYGAEAQDALAGADLVVISCFPFDEADEVDALQEAIAGKRIAVDPNPRAGMLRDAGDFVRGFEQIAAVSDIVKVGADDAVLLYDGDLDALRARLLGLGAKAVLATTGSAGAVLQTGETIVSAPISTLPGPIVDTVGAGDSTLAAVADGLSRRVPAEDAGWRALLVRAMDIAAATCRAEGGLLRTPEENAAQGSGS